MILLILVHMKKEYQFLRNITLKYNKEKNVIN
jgi:hypothetical protein